MLLHVERDHRLDSSALIGIEVATSNKVLGQRPLLIASPGLEGGHELHLVDQAVLQGQQVEEKITLGGYGSHGPGS
jgi:hypothetical protein